MITQVTAQRISDVLVEIEGCKSALDLIEMGLGTAGEPDALINVATNKKDDVITILLTPEIAMRAIAQQAKVLETERATLNEKAIEEAKQ